MVSPWVQYLTVIEFFGEYIGLHLIVSKFTCVQINNEILFELTHRYIVIHVLKKILVTDTDLSVDNICQQLKVSLLLF